MATGINAVYLYDGSFDGLLTAIFEAYRRKEIPEGILVEQNAQLGLGQHQVLIATDEEKARRVEKGLVGKLGSPFYRKIWITHLSGAPGKDTAIYRYVRRGLQVGRKVYSDLANDDVLLVDKLYSHISTESHRYKQFVRFSLLEGGVFYAKISPVNSVVPLIMPHFTDRYCVQPFLIHDDVHNLVGVFNLEEWHMVETEELTLPDPAAAEYDFRRMWKQFYDAIAVKERLNPKCRRNFMPKRYWDNITEFNFAETPKTRAAKAGNGLERVDAG